MTHNTTNKAAKKIKSIETLLLQVTGSESLTHLMMNNKLAEFNFRSIKDMLKDGKEDAVLKYIQQRYYIAGSKFLH